MLTKQQALAEYDFRGGRVIPDRLTQRQHAAYVGHAGRMLQIYRAGKGRTRRELHREVQGILDAEEDCPPRRIAAFCKLLDDRSVFDKDRRGRAAELRREVFHFAASRHPLVSERDLLFDNSEHAVKQAIADQLGMAWPEIDKQLFADVIELQRLVKFPGYQDAAALLARYNVAQVQAALFGAVSLTVWAKEDFKTIIRHAKLAGLMHEITTAGDGRYCFRFDGPASVLRHTRRYGAAMACFLPSLVACRDWRLHAQLQPFRGGTGLMLALDSGDGLHSHLPAPEEFDSGTEAEFVRRWGDEPRCGWRLAREERLLVHGQQVFVPDFVFRHENGRQVLLEIIGFWTPEYLRKKVETLASFPDATILLAAAAAAAARGQLPELPSEPILYKTFLRPEAVVERLESLLD